MKTLDKIKKDFFESYSNIICVDVYVAHGFIDNKVHLGWDSNDNNVYEGLFHEMGHFIFANENNIFAECNWGFRSEFSGNIDKEWLLKVIDNEMKVMSVAYTLLDHYEIEDWIISYEDYSDLMTNGFRNTLNIFLGEGRYDLINCLDEDIHDFFLYEIAISLRTRTIFF